MRHRNHNGKLGRTAGPRLNLLRGLVAALLENEKIRTTEVRAKEARRHADKMITLAKEGSQFSRRQAFAFLQKKEVVHNLFENLAKRYTDRAGGYTRVVLDGPRMGDGAMMAYLELVDRKIEIITPEEAEKKKSLAQRAREMRKEMAAAH